MCALGIGRDVEGSLVGLGDAKCDGETETGALCFGSEERFEDPFLEFGGYATAIVFEADEEGLLFLPGTHV